MAARDRGRASASTTGQVGRGKDPTKRATITITATTRSEQDVVKRERLRLLTATGFGIRSAKTKPLDQIDHEVPEEDACSLVAGRDQKRAVPLSTERRAVQSADRDQRRSRPNIGTIAMACIRRVRCVIADRWRTGSKPERPAFDPCGDEAAGHLLWDLVIYLIEGLLFLLTGFPNPVAV